MPIRKDENASDDQDGLKWAEPDEENKIRASIRMMSGVSDKEIKIKCVDVEGAPASEYGEHQSWVTWVWVITTKSPLSDDQKESITKWGIRCFYFPPINGHLIYPVFKMDENLEEQSEGPLVRSGMSVGPEDG
jgi:hypothetical protein